MDDRKKQIEELEKNKREYMSALDSLLERFGESLLSRAGEQEPEEGDEGAASSGEAGTYRRLRKEIADSEAAIISAEEKIRRFKELEKKIELKERDEGERAKNLAGVYGRLGKALFDSVGGDASGAYEECTAPSRGQAEDLVDKIRSLEDRLAELEQKEGSNVFAWIGKGAQSLVLRSFLTKAQDNLEQIYRAAGEHYSRRADGAAPPEIAGLFAEIEQVKEEARSLSEDLAKLKEERRVISESFGAEGGPLKYIQTAKNRIASVREELRILYRGFGARAASLRQEEGADSSLVDTLVTAGDQAFLDEAGRINGTIHNTGAAIEKLHASIAIDEERSKIEKYRRLIEQKRLKIAEAEKDLAEFEGCIQEAEKYIAELQKLL
ncbi:MAG: hypothetical protein LBG57_09955 [Treponema sp.]|jgi:hypothetical protein|nr:hypothetical protein [Treponema sp.]